MFDVFTVLSFVLGISYYIAQAVSNFSLLMVGVSPGRTHCSRFTANHKVTVSLRLDCDSNEGFVFHSADFCFHCIKYTAVVAVVVFFFFFNYSS